MLFIYIDTCDKKNHSIFLNLVKMRNDKKRTKDRKKARQQKEAAKVGKKEAVIQWAATGAFITSIVIILINLF